MACSKNNHLLSPLSLNPLAHSGPMSGLSVNPNLPFRISPLLSPQPPRTKIRPTSLTKHSQVSSHQLPPPPWTSRNYPLTQLKFLTPTFVLQLKSVNLLLISQIIRLLVLTIFHPSSLNQLPPLFLNLSLPSSTYRSRLGLSP